MILPALLAAALSEGSANPRARTHELQGRLGLRASKTTGTMARLAHIERQRGWVARRIAEGAMIITGTVGTFTEGIASSSASLFPPWTFRGGSGGSHLSEIYDKVAFWQVSGFFTPQGGIEAPSGTVTRLDGLLEWIAAQGAWMVDEERTNDEIRAVIRAVTGGNIAPRSNGFYVIERDSLEHAPDGTPRGRRTDKLQPLEIRCGAFLSIILSQIIQRGVFDFLEHQRPAGLMSMSIIDVVAASQAWHDSFYSSEGVGTPARPGVVVARWPDGGRIERLVTKSQNEDEGKSMAHCVGGYWAQVRDDESVIYSYRDKDGISKGTVEVVFNTVGDPYIEQARGVSNDPVDDIAAIRRLKQYLVERQRVEDPSDELRDDRSPKNRDGRRVAIVHPDVIRAITLEGDDGEPWDFTMAEGDDDHNRRMMGLDNASRNARWAHKQIQGYLEEVSALEDMDDEAFEAWLREAGLDEGHVQGWLERGPQDYINEVIFSEVGIHQAEEDYIEAIKSQREEIDDIVRAVDFFFADVTGQHPFEGPDLGRYTIFDLEHFGHYDRECVCLTILDPDEVIPKVGYGFPEDPEEADVSSTGDYITPGHALIGAGVLMTEAQLIEQVGRREDIDYTSGMQPIELPKVGDEERPEVQWTNRDLVRYAVSRAAAPDPEMLSLSRRYK